MNVMLYKEDICSFRVNTINKLISYIMIFIKCNKNISFFQKGVAQ